MIHASSISKHSNLTQTLITLLDRCKSMYSLKQIHALTITLNLSQDDCCMSKILSFTAISNLGDIDYSCKILLHLPDPRIFYWNSVIRGYSKSNNPIRSVSLFIEMLRSGVSPDYFTYPFLAKAAARLSKLELGKAVHSHIMKAGHVSDRFILNSLVHMYGTYGDIMNARKAFDEIHEKNLVSWNSMLDGYAKCGDMDKARQVFELMPERDVVTWSSLIDGYVKSGDYKEAMSIFDKMRKVGHPKANEVTMVSVLCACAHLGALDQGSLMHKYMIDNGFPLTLVLRTSLVDMYAKCGAIEEALSVFRRVKLVETDVLIWNAMIGGLAMHGYVQESLDLFMEMEHFGITPDEITFLCVLSACAHGGLVNEAWYFFISLNNKFGMTPKSEHYSCMVDVLSRAGQVSEAYDFVCEMPMEPTASMLGALLTGCMNHGNLELAEMVGKKLIGLDPDHDGRYVGLSNVYAVFKRWDDARKLREAMEMRGLKKYPGCSFVEMSGSLHRFIAHDKSHQKSEDVYSMLNLIVSQMKHDIDCDNQEHYLYNMDGD